MSEREQFIIEVVALKDRAARLELWRTMHAFDAVTCAYGEDVAGYPARVRTIEVQP